MREDIQEGMVVYSSDGEKVGKVRALSGEQFQIEKGLFFVKDYFARYDEIDELRDGAIYLIHRKAQLRTDPSLGAEGRSSADSAPAPGEVLRVPVLEEQLEATKRSRDVGALKLEKHTVTEQRTLRVPVTREEVVVERVPATGARAEASDASFTEEVVRVPLREEEVEVTKRPVVREEVRVRKEPLTEERRVADSIRREEVKVEREGAVYRRDPDERS